MHKAHTFLLAEIETGVTFKKNTWGGNKKVEGGAVRSAVS